MNKASFIGTIVGGMIAYSICQYSRMKDEEKRLKELNDTIDITTKSLMEQVNRDIFNRNRQEHRRNKRDSEKN